MSHHPCPACEGNRQYTVMVPNIQKSNGVTYHSPLPPMVPRHYICETCSGRGRVDCLVCEDEGYVIDFTAPMMGPFPMLGRSSSMKPCIACDRGRTIAHVITHPELTGAESSL